MVTKDLKSTKGITLISLVVSIVVLLILAGVSIVTLTGDNGLLNRTTSAKEKTKRAELQEVADLAYQSAIIKQRTGESVDDFLAEIARKMTLAGYEIEDEPANPSTVTGVSLVELDENNSEVSITTGTTLSMNTGNSNARRLKVKELTAGGGQEKNYYVKKDGLYHQITLSSNKVVVAENGVATLGDDDTENVITLTVTGLTGLVKVGDTVLSGTTATVEAGNIITITPADEKVDEASVSVTLNNDTQNKFEVGVVIIKELTVADIFDSTGNDSNGLHIGDFVDYTAGNWDATSLAKITASGAKLAPTTTKPTAGYTFGGFGSTASRDGNAESYDSSTYTYVKYTSGNAVTGWRVFDVDTTSNKITLISAGCPEDYYHPYGTSYGYISQYILTGDSTGKPSSLDLSSYTPRDWTMYENSSKGAIENSAVALSKTRLDEWYSKYVVASADTYTSSIFQKIYNENSFKKYQTLIDNYSYYWLASAYPGYTNSLSYVGPNNKYVSRSSNLAFGVRVLVSISGVQLTKSATTKTLQDPRESGTTYTYAYWNIQPNTQANNP